MLKKLVRFAITGGLVTGIHLLIVVLFMQFLYANETLANGIAFIVANTVSFFMNTLWSFSSHVQGFRLLRFSVVTLISFLLTLSIAYLAGFFGLHYLAGVFLIICIIPGVTFLLHNFWTYQNNIPE